jgi:transcription-repair coupling factor (superfamily II helicase)
VNIEIIEAKLTVLKSYQTYNSCVICDDNISRIFVKKRVKRNMSKKLDLLLQIKPGDYIVHVDHGI